MPDKDSIMKKIEKETADLAKKVEDFAEKVAADEEPLVILPQGDGASPQPSKKPNP